MTLAIKLVKHTEETKNETSYIHSYDNCQIRNI